MPCACSAATPATETAYADDPVAVAERFQEEGARRLHVVDLDAALGEGDNREVVAAICHAVGDPGPGRRRDADPGGHRRPHGGRGVARDPRDGGGRRPHLRLAGGGGVRRARGGGRGRPRRPRDGQGLDRRRARRWRRRSPALDEAGTPRYLVTSIARDGTLDGPDLRLYTQVLKLTQTPVIASGGVRDADDIWALRDLGAEAAVTGKALYERTLKLSQVIRG